MHLSKWLAFQFKPTSPRRVTTLGILPAWVWRAPMNSTQAVTGWRSGSIQKACCRFSITLKWGEKEIKLNKHQKCMLKCKCKLYLFKGLLWLLNYSSLKTKQKNPWLFSSKQLVFCAQLERQARFILGMTDLQWSAFSKLVPIQDLRRFSVLIKFSKLLKKNFNYSYK